MIMSGHKFCPGCGSNLVAGDRFCGECGFDLASLATNSPESKTNTDNLVAPTAYTAGEVSSPVRNYEPTSQSQITSPTRNYEPTPQTQMTSPMEAYEQKGGNMGSNLGSNVGSNKGPLIIMISLLILLFLAGGGLYWWFSSRESGGQPSNVISPNGNSDNINMPIATENTAEDGNTPSSLVDLSRAATYLSKPGLKATFHVNYPDGMAGIVDRISGSAVPDKTVKVSDVEIGIERGEEYGFGFHYVERADGTYYIMDSSPYEIFPVLKNNLTTGQTWNYQDEYGQIVWTVLDMGVDLDLGFMKFSDCLLLHEDNQAVGWETITYYAPGYGNVLVTSPGGNLEYYRMTDMDNIDLAGAVEIIKKWCPNYQNIKDDRTQSH